MDSDQQKWVTNHLRTLWIIYCEMCRNLSSPTTPSEVPPATFTFDEFSKFIWKWRC